MMSDTATIVTAICGVIIAAIGVLNTWLSVKSAQASARAETAGTAAEAASKFNSEKLVVVEEKADKTIVAAERAITVTEEGNKAVAEVKAVAEQAVKETQDGNATLEKVHKAVNGGSEGLQAKINEMQSYVSEVMKATTEQERQRGAETISARLGQLHDTLMLKVIEVKTESATVKAENAALKAEIVALRAAKGG